MIKITADTKKIALSCNRRVYKTEGFIPLTRRIIAIDAFISRVAEGVFRETVSLSEACFSAQTDDGLYTLFFRRKGGDIVFYRFLSASSAEGGTDRKLQEYKPRIL